jgi:uncharacterized protein YndB with AHSA1/START domain
MTAETAAVSGLHIVRTVAAPPDRVFHAWTDPAALAAWFWPRPAWASTYEVDLRVGGRYRFATTGLPEGENFAVRGVFRVVQPPELLVYTWYWDGDPGESLVTVRFLDRNGATELVLDHEELASEERAVAFREGWESVIERLVEQFSRG